MALWVSFSKARRLPNISSETTYKRIAQFRKAVKAEALGSAVWARRKTGLSLNEANLEVDVQAIPGVVPALRKDGSKVS